MQGNEEKAKEVQSPTDEVFNTGIGLSSVVVLALLLLVFGAIGGLKAIAIILIFAFTFFATGMFVVEPNAARVITFFGKYIGTVTSNGFHITKPLTMKAKVSLKVTNTNIVFSKFISTSLSFELIKFT